MLAAVANVFEWSFEGGYHDCTPLPVGEGTVKLDGARLSCQGRYLGFRIPPPHPFHCIHSFPFSMCEWVLASLSPPSSSPLTVRYYIGISLLCPPCPLTSSCTPPPPPCALTCLHSFISLSFLLFSPSLPSQILSFITIPLFSSLFLLKASAFSHLPPSVPSSLLSCLQSRSCEPQCLARMNGSYLSR